MKQNLRPLTEAEVRVMTGLARGLSRKMIAGELGSSVAAVNFHLENIFRKWGINSATAAVSLFVESK